MSKVALKTGYESTWTARASSAAKPKKSKKSKRKSHKPTDRFLAESREKESEALLAMLAERIAETLRLREESEKLSENLRRVMAELRVA